MLHSHARSQLLPEKLAAAGYRSHFVGKGHLGYMTEDHLPVHRGFASHVGYLAGMEGYVQGETPAISGSVTQPNEPMSCHLQWIIVRQTTTRAKQ